MNVDSLNLVSSAWRKLQIGFYLLLLLPLFSCQQKGNAEVGQTEVLQQGIYHTAQYLPKLHGLKVGVVAHHCSLLGETHLVDTLLGSGVDVKVVFAPEHGFRGIADAGEEIDNSKDAKTGLPIISLYGKNKKPSSAMLQDLDYVLFDIQDVGARFYTYVSTLLYVMEACSENGIPLLVLDRPNPNAHRIGGPVLDTANFKSFVGVLPIPILYGLTIGELATMIQGEWLPGEIDLTVVWATGYKRGMDFSLSPKPSPNLPSKNAVFMYPSLCFFEGTPVSAGRGTNKPFEWYGHPDFKEGEKVKPVATEGAKFPKFKNKALRFVVAKSDSLGVDYSFIWKAHTMLKGGKEPFFNSFFNLLAGTDRLRKSLEKGDNPQQIEALFRAELTDYKVLREKYLYYH